MHRYFWDAPLVRSLLAGFVFLTGCSLSPGLGVPHEDPEPIGSAPWEMGTEDPSDSSGPPTADAQARTAARNKSRKGRHDTAAAPKASATATPSAAPIAVKADADGDGVEDARDMCPQSAGPDDSNPAWAGCPLDAPQRKPAPLFEELNLVFGDAPRSLDASETDVMNSLAGELKSEPSITLSTYARNKAQGEGWLKVVKASLTKGGVDPTRIITQVCVQQTGLTHTIVTRGTKACD